MYKSFSSDFLDLNINMSIIQQLSERRIQQGLTLKELEKLTGLDTSVISHTLSGNRDSRLSTVEALAGAMNASLVAVPNYLLPEVLRLMSGKAIGPDDVPSAAERILKGEV